MVKQVFVGCALVAGLTSCMQPVKSTVQIHPNCPEIPATTFATVGLDAKAGALQFGKLVTVGEFSATTTPALLSAISQSVRDDQITDALICAARKRGELKTRGQIAHAWTVARFYRTNPTPDLALKFHNENPFPKTSSGQVPGPEIQETEVIRQLVLEGYTLKKSIQQEYRNQRQQKTFEANADMLLKDWRNQFGGWNGKVRATIQTIDPILDERFDNVKSTGATAGENLYWDALDRNLNAKIEFLNRYIEKP